MSYAYKFLLNISNKIICSHWFSYDVFRRFFLIFLYNIQGWRKKIPKTSFKMGLIRRSSNLFVIRTLNISGIFILGIYIHFIVIHQNFTKFLFTTSIYPILYGRNVVDLFNFVLIFSRCVVQNELSNLVSLSEMILFGIPKCTNICWIIIFFSIYLNAFGVENLEKPSFRVTFIDGS